MSALSDALAPVRAALLARARADADATGAAAGATAADVLDEARVQATAILDRARAEGERDAAEVRAREAARAHRETRQTILRAQREAYDLLRRQARAHVLRLQSDPAYPALLERLRAWSVGVLGPDAVVHGHPDGGIVAATAGRRLDLSLPALADRAVDELGGEVTSLWAPDG